MMMGKTLLAGLTACAIGAAMSFAAVAEESGSGRFKFNTKGKGSWDEMRLDQNPAKSSGPNVEPVDCDELRVKLDLARGRSVQITDVATAILAFERCPEVIEELAKL